MIRCPNCGAYLDIQKPTPSWRQKFRLFKKPIDPPLVVCVRWRGGDYAIHYTDKKYVSAFEKTIEENLLIWFYPVVGVSEIFFGDGAMIDFIFEDWSVLFMLVNGEWVEM